MSFHLNDVPIHRLPDTLLAAQLQYLRHYRSLMRARDTDPFGNPCPQLWHWAVMFQPDDVAEVPRIEAGPASAMPRWLKGHTLAIIAEESGEVLAWDQ